MLKIKEIQPIAQQLLVTENVYEKDDFTESGILVNKRGDIKNYQTVIAVGNDVEWVKPGDVIMVNFAKYAINKIDPNSLRAGDDNNPVVGLRLNEVELTGDDGNTQTGFIIDRRDIMYILKDYEEVQHGGKKAAGKRLIMPDTRIHLN